MDNVTTETQTQVDVKTETTGRPVIVETPTSSFRAFWAYINRKTIAPWVVFIASSVWFFSHQETVVSAQSAQIQEIKQDTAAKISDLSNTIYRDHEDLHKDLIERLEDIKQSNRNIDGKLESARSDQDHLKSNIVILCTKLNAPCR